MRCESKLEKDLMDTLRNLGVEIESISVEHISKIQDYCGNSTTKTESAETEEKE